MSACRATLAALALVGLAGGCGGRESDPAHRLASSPGAAGLADDSGGAVADPADGSGGAVADPVVTDGAPVQCQPGSGFDGDSYGPYMIDDGSDLGRLSGFESMLGDLFIVMTRIDSLSDLSCLTSVTGHAGIDDNDALEDLGGLDRLTRVGWTLTISQDDRLTNVDALNGLTSIGESAAIAGGQPGTGNFYIGRNPALLNLDGLRNLSHLDGNLTIADNASLPTCDAVALKRQLEATGWTRQATICGNLPDSCGSDPCGQ